MAAASLPLQTSNTVSKENTLNTIVILSVVIPFVLFIVCVMASLMLARRKNTQMVENSPGTLPYTWGFFLGYSGIIGGIFIAAAVGIVVLAGYYQDWFLILLTYAIGLGVASYGVLLRYRWGWLIHIPLTLNPGMWAFNSVYIHNRWREISRHQQRASIP
ncbi:MAG: hypothetical protein R3F24_09430 [Gammaproteobacteria bacterium]